MDELCHSQCTNLLSNWTLFLQYAGSQEQTLIVAVLMLCYLLLWSGLPSAGSEVASDAIYLVIQKSVCRCCSSLLGAATVLPSAGRDGHSAAHWACYDTEIRGSRIGHIIWDTEHFTSMVRSTDISRYRIKPLQIISGGSKLNSMHVRI